MNDREQRARLLLDAARRGDDPPSGLQEKIAAKLGQRLGLGVATSSALSTKTTGASLLATLAKATLIGATLGGGLLIGTMALHKPKPTPHAVNSGAWPSSSAPEARATAGQATGPDSPADAPGTPDRLLPTDMPLPLKTSAPPSMAPHQHPRIEESDTLRAEAAGLRAAHEAVQAGDPRRALALLADQERAFRGGALAEERAAVRILALCKLGRTAEARSAVQRFLATSPHSPLVPRVRAECASPDDADR